MLIVTVHSIGLITSVVMEYVAFMHRYAIKKMDYTPEIQQFKPDKI